MSESEGNESHADRERRGSAPRALTAPSGHYQVAFQLKHGLKFLAILKEFEQACHTGAVLYHRIVTAIYRQRLFVFKDTKASIDNRYSDSDRRSNSDEVGRGATLLGSVVLTSLANTCPLALPSVKSAQMESRSRAIHAYLAILESIEAQLCTAQNVQVIRLVEEEATAVAAGRRCCSEPHCGVCEVLRRVLEAHRGMLSDVTRKQKFLRRLYVCDFEENFRDDEDMGTLLGLSSISALAKQRKSESDESPELEMSDERFFNAWCGSGVMSSDGVLITGSSALELENLLRSHFE